MSTLVCTAVVVEISVSVVVIVSGDPRPLESWCSAPANRPIKTPLSRSRNNVTPSRILERSDRGS